MTQVGNPRLRAALVEYTLVERKSGYLMLGKLQAQTAAETNRVLLPF